MSTGGPLTFMSWFHHVRLLNSPHESSFSPSNFDCRNALTEPCMTWVRVRLRVRVRVKALTCVLCGR